MTTVTQTQPSEEPSSSGKPDIAALRKKFERYVNNDKSNRTLHLEDTQFSVGAPYQWPETIRKEREDDGRPCLTISRMNQFVKQVTGDIRQNKPAIRVTGADEKSDKKVAEIYEGLIRNIEQNSRAGYVYAQAGDQAVRGGFGAWRIVTQYTDDDAFEQDIRIKAIPNALSVVWDDLATEWDKADANDCYVYSFVSEDSFKAQWPDAAIVDFDNLPEQTDSSLLDWYSKEQGIRVAEYWCKEPVTKTICLLGDGRVVDKDDYPDVKGKPKVLKERKVKTHKICQYIISGSEVLEGPIAWAGKYIPIIPVVGEEIWVGETRITKGIVRDAKDSQRLFNFMRSASAEVVALQPKAPFLVTAVQIEGNEQAWAMAHRKSLPHLTFKPDKDMPGFAPRREPPPQAAGGMIAEANLAADDMKATTGIYDAALGAKSNETSGIAIRERDQQGDTATYHFGDNLRYAVAATGRQLVDLIPRIYDTARIVRVLSDDGSYDMVPINQEIKTADGVKIVHDLTVGKYDVIVDAGPSYKTKRQEASEGMLAFVQAVPEAGPLIGDLIAKNQDWPNSDEVAQRLGSLVPPQAKAPPVGPDGQPLPPPPPPPDPKMIELEGKQKLMQAELDGKRSIAQQELDLKRYVAKENVNIAREEIAMKIGLQQEAADREAILNGFPQVDQATQMLGHTHNSMQELSHLIGSHAIIAGAPDQIVRDPATNLVVGKRKILTPEQRAMLHPALAHLAGDQVAQRDAGGNITGLQPQPGETIQ